MRSQSLLTPWQGSCPNESQNAETDEEKTPFYGQTDIHHDKGYGKEQHYRDGRCNFGGLANTAMLLPVENQGTECGLMDEPIM